MKRIAFISPSTIAFTIWLSLLFGLFVYVFAPSPAVSASGTPVRFIRQDWSRLDPDTVVDVMRDQTTNRCYAVYRWSPPIGPAVSATSLGEVPCGRPGSPTPPVPPQSSPIK